MKWVDYQTLKQLYRLAASDTSYLRGRGWFSSAISRRPVDSAGHPLPWLSYPFIDFIVPRLHTDMFVVEFGAGQSTLFWASHVGHVLSVEHDPAWYAELLPKLPKNATLVRHEFDHTEPVAYARAADQARGQANLVLVDGPERDLTLRHAVQLLRPNGVLVLDNANRGSYAAAAQALVTDGAFRRLDFIGMGPGAARECATALFYRSENCLGV